MTALPAPDDRARLAAVWAFRAHAERGAQARFDALAGALRRARAGEDIARAAAAAGDDERRHEGLCQGLAERLGGAAPLPDDGVDDLSSPAWSVDERVTFALVAGCCVTESINAAVLGATLARCDHAPVRAALRELLRDEVRHAQLGWAHLERARGRVDLGFVGSRMPAVFAQTFRPGFFGPQASGVDVDADAGARWGLLPHAESVAVVRAVVPDVVLAGLERAGVDTGPARAWWLTHA